MSEKADALLRTYTAHGNDDRALELATNIGLTVEQFAAAKMLQIRAGMKVSAIKIRKLTLDLFGVGTQPRPSVWQNSFKETIEEYL